MNWSATTVADVPTAVVTVMSVVPTVPAGEVASMLVDVTTVTLVARDAPNSTIFPAVKPVPVMVTTVPPFGAPDVGLSPVIVGGKTYVNLSAALAALVPYSVVTVTSTTPVPAGTSTPRLVLLLTTKLVAGTEPNLTTVALARSVPVITTSVPPSIGPDVVLSAVTTGAEM